MCTYHAWLFAFVIIESRFAVNSHQLIYIHDWKASFVFYETIEAMLNLCLTVYMGNSIRMKSIKALPAVRSNAVVLLLVYCCSHCLSGML